MRKRIEFKVLILTYKCRNNLAPPYLTEHLDMYEPRHTLRSAAQVKLRAPKSCFKSYGDRAFSYAAPVLWNDLPPAIKTASSLDLFQSNLSITCLTVVMVISVMYLLLDALSVLLNFSGYCWLCV